MKKMLSIFLCLSLVLSLCPSAFCEGGSELTDFTDDCGRSVGIPAEIERVAAAGSMAQIYLMALCPELMVGLSTAYTENDAVFIGERYMELPVLGQLYGGKGTIDPEALLAAAPQVIVDVGEAKGSIVSDLDELSEQTGIPVVHINANVPDSDRTFIRLGELTGRTEKAEELAVWCRSRCDSILDIMARVDEDGARKSLIYCLGPKGLNVLADGSFHAETLSIVADNAAQVDNVSPSGLGNEVDMEQLMLWDPEYIIFAPDSVYGEVTGDELWQQLNAVRNGRVYRTPFGVYGWLASPPAIQRYLGMLWLTALLYPEYINYDLQEEVSEYYRLFCGCELTEESYAELIKGAF